MKNLNSYAKINLTLKIEEKRKDKYHNISSVMQTISLHDKIKLKKNKKIVCKINVKDIPTDENNLAVKAAKIFFNYLNMPNGVKIKIKKKIPTKAGLAGGSSNAATTLLGLNKLFKTNLSKEVLLKLAKKVGSDVPFLLFGGTALVKGVGDLIYKTNPFKCKYILIVKPNFNISTKKAYEEFDEINNYKKNLNNLTKKLIELLKEQQPIEKMVKYFFNDFEKILKTDLIFKIKEKMLELGAISSIMTGSGSAVFGIFNNRKYIKKAKKFFKKQKLKSFICKTIKNYF